VRIQNFRAPHETAAQPVSASDEAAEAAVVVAAPASQPASDAIPRDAIPRDAIPRDAAPRDAATQIDRQTLEIAFLKARIQHLDLVLETARSLMGSNHERLLRRLHELPREIVELSAQLRRVDPAAAAW
jgi:hypothetical protein